MSSLFNIKLKYRLFLFIILIIIPLVLVYFLQNKLLVFKGITMGTQYTIKTSVPKWVSKDDVQFGLQNKLNEMILIFSTWEENSEITQFNDFKSVRSQYYSNEFVYVMEQAHKYFYDSLGHFDPTIKPVMDKWGFNKIDTTYNLIKDIDKHLSNRVGMDKIIISGNYIQKLNPELQVDLSGIAKGYVVDQLSLILEGYSSSKYMIEIGGEILVKTSADNDHWDLGIVKPTYDISKNELLKVISIGTGAVATSGDYNNYFQENGKIYSHIFNPIKKEPVFNHLSSVTVIADHCMDADALATMLFSMGLSKGLSYIESDDRIDALFVFRTDGSQFDYVTSSGFSRYLKHN